MITTVLYDIDQMVINAPRYNFAMTYVKEFGIVYERMLPFFKGAFQKCLVGKADIKKELPVFLTEWNWHGSVDEFLAYWFTAESSLDARLIEHIRALRAKGVRCFIVTNNEKYRTDYIWNELCLKEVFDGIFSSSRIGSEKKHPEFWERVASELEEKDKSRVLFWDDDRENVETARAFGFKAEVYTDYDSYKRRMSILHL